jgi:hypothetical protein
MVKMRTTTKTSKALTENAASDAMNDLRTGWSEPNAKQVPRQGGG